MASEPAKNRIKSRNIFRELPKDTSSSLQQPTPTGVRERVNLQSQSPSKTTTTSTGVEGVVCGTTAGKKQVWSSPIKEELQKEEKERQSSVLDSEMTGSAVVVKLQQERQGGKERREEQKEDEGGKREEGEKREVGGKEREEEGMMERENEGGKMEEEVKKEEGEKREEGEKAEPFSAIRLRRRNKTVEKPVKTLGIASDPDITPSSTNQIPVVGTFLHNTRHTSLATIEDILIAFYCM